MKSLSYIRNEYERNEELRGLLVEGKSLEELKKKYDVSMSLLTRLKYEDSYNEIQNKLKNRIDNLTEVSDYFKEGYTLEELADMYGTTRQNISRMLKIAEVDRSEGGVSKQKHDRMEQIKDYAEEGLTLEDICEKLELHEDMVRNYAYSMDIVLHSRTKERVTQLISDILKLRKEGHTQSSICKLLDVSQSYVSKILLTHEGRTFLTPEEYLKRDIKVLQMSEEGKSIEEIMQEFDLSESNVRRILYKYKEESSNDLLLKYKDIL